MFVQASRKRCDLPVVMYHTICMYFVCVCVYHTKQLHGSRPSIIAFRSPCCHLVHAAYTFNTRTHTPPTLNHHLLHSLPRGAGRQAPTSGALNTITVEIIDCAPQLRRSTLSQPVSAASTVCNGDGTSGNAMHGVDSTRCSTRCSTQPCIRSGYTGLSRLS